jgi:hypothetical protein
MTIANPIVLVVEDEFVLRLIAVEFVEDAGFQALSAASADEALSILETRVEMCGCCSRTSRCQARWTGSAWPTPCATVGLRSSCSSPPADATSEPRSCPTADGLSQNPTTARRCRRHFRRWRRSVRADQHALEHCPFRYSETGFFWNKDLDRRGRAGERPRTTTVGGDNVRAFARRLHAIRRARCGLCHCGDSGCRRDLAVSEAGLADAHPLPSADAAIVAHPASARAPRGSASPTLGLGYAG